MRVPSWPEAVGEPKEVDLVDGAQHFGDHALDDLILERRHAERTLPAIGFWDVDTPDRLWPVAPGVDACAEGLKVGFQVLLIVRHRDPIDPRTRPSLLSSERSFKRREVNMMQQGGEPGLGGLVGRCVHPCEVSWQGDPALGPDLTPLARVPPGLAPSLGPSRFLRRRHQYYEPVRLPTSARMSAPALPC